MEIKIGDEVVVGMIFSQGHIFRGRGIVKAKLEEKKKVKYLVNDEWRKEDDLYPVAVWDELIERQYR